MSGPCQTKASPSSDEVVAIVVHKSNPIENISFEELRKLCFAEQKHWANGRKVSVALCEPGQLERDAVLRVVFGMKENEFHRHFLQSAFVGDVNSAPKQLANTTFVRRFVVNVPGAIGFVRLSEVDDSVKVLRLDDLAPGQKGYPLLLFTKKAEP